jgi:cell shape-determining protein MreC
MDDLRDTPGYRVHRAVSALNSIDDEQLNQADKERLAEVRQTLASLEVLERQR